MQQSDTVILAYDYGEARAAAAALVEELEHSLAARQLG
jgi:hypothetical protein